MSYMSKYDPTRHRKYRVDAPQKPTVMREAFKKVLDKHG